MNAVCADAYHMHMNTHILRVRTHSHHTPQGLSYSTTAGDEVEDLLLLLAFIKVRGGGAYSYDRRRMPVRTVEALAALLADAGVRLLL